MAEFRIKGITLFGAIKKSMYLESYPKGKVIIVAGDNPAEIKLITGNREIRSVITMNTEGQVFIDEPVCFDAQPIIGLLSVFGQNIFECTQVGSKIVFTDMTNKRNKASSPSSADKWNIENAVDLINGIDKQVDFVASLNAFDWNRLRLVSNFVAEPERINLHCVRIQVSDKAISLMGVDGFMMGYMWTDGIATGKHEPFMVHPKTVDFNAYDGVIIYKSDNTVFVQHKDEMRVSSTVSGSFPAESIKKALADSSIIWHMTLDSGILSELISAVGRIDYSNNPSQVRIRSNGDTVTVESIESLSDQSVAATMPNQQESDFSFVLASKYLQKAIGYLKQGSENSQNMIVGESGESIIVFATSNMPGRFGFARIHDADQTIQKES